MFAVLLVIVHDELEDAVLAGALEEFDGGMLQVGMDVELPATPVVEDVVV